MPEIPEVLFVCVHNAGRSQMAAALLDHRADGKVLVRSAGSDPADTINPAVAAVMAELGLDLSTQFPKPITGDAIRAADVVITMGCWDACPIYPGKRYLDWDSLTPLARRPSRSAQSRRDRPARTPAARRTHRPGQQHLTPDRTGCEAACSQPRGGARLS